MTNMNTILVVGNVDCNDRVNTRLMAMTLGKPNRSAAEYGGLGIDIASVGSVDISSLVESSFIVEVRAASVDAATSIVALIADEIRDLADIVVGLVNSAYIGTLKVRIGECIEIPLASPWILTAQYTTLVEIVVRREPYVLSPTETLYNAAGFNAPCLVPLFAQIGQVAAPLDLLLDAGALELSACYIGHTTDEAAVIGDFVKPLVGATWSAGAAAADAAGYPSGGVWRHTAAAYTDIDVTNLAPGEYLVLANCKGTTASTDTIQTPFSGPVLIPTTTLHLLPFGVISLPNRAVRWPGTDLLRVTITGGGGSEYAAVNYVALLPVSRGIFGVRFPFLIGGHAHTLRWENGTSYENDLPTLPYAYGGSAPLRTLGGQLVVLAEQVTSAPTTRLYATVSATPRHEQFPSP